MRNINERENNGLNIDPCGTQRFVLVMTDETLYVLICYLSPGR